MEAQNSSKFKFDPVKVITQALNLLKHGRLMLLMAAVGILGGIGYYVYSKPLYMAKSVTYVRGFGAPVSARGMVELAGRGMTRGFLQVLISSRIKLRACQKLGLLGPNATADEVNRHVPIVRYEVVDSSHVELTVFAYDVEVTRQFAQTMVEEFVANQEENWERYRTDALARYAEDVTRLEEQIESGRTALMEKERDSHLTEVSITQQSLTQIPRELVETRERIKRMEAIQAVLASHLPGSDGIDEVLSTLSLLSSFEKETELSVGSLVRRTATSGRPMVAATAAAPTTDVIVQPAMVEELEPWRKLERERRLIEIEIGDAAKIYLPDHAILRNLNERLSNVERSLRAELEVARQRFDLEYGRLKQKLETLNQRIPEYHQVTEQLDRTAYDYRTLAQGQQMWDKARERLADRLSVLSFNEERDWVDVQYRGHSFLRDQIPVSPNKTKLVMLSLALAFAGAFGAPVLLNMLDTTAATVHGLEEYTGLRGIGIVPMARKELLEDVHRSPAQGASVPNFLLETIRVIRSNICLHPNREKRSQVIMVTSARPQEGKTSQAANLAWAFQSMGEKTLLIDCDLRRGRQHSFIGLDNDIGMSALLSGAAGPDQAIIKIGNLSSSFDAIPRGPIIAGATEILCQKRFEDLMALFRQHYDRIVLDTPPVLGLSETSSLQRVCDGVVLVVRAETTSKKDVADAVTILDKAGAHFFGFVLNAVDLSKASNYYNYYYYSATYYDDFDEHSEDDQPGGGKAPRKRKADGHRTLPAPVESGLKPCHSAV